MMNTRLPWLAAATLLLSAGVRAPAQTAYSFDAAHSTLQINVYKEGFFKAFGHEHLVAAKEFSGAVKFDSNHLENSSVTLRVASKSLTVVDPGESEKDRAEVQATMSGATVLDVARFPEISFQSARVEKTEKQGDAWHILLAGALRLHGVEKPVSFPLTLRISAGELSAQGELFLLQTGYGITPVKVGGGAVKVKDRLHIQFEIHARPAATP